MDRRGFRSQGVGRNKTSSLERNEVQWEEEEKQIRWKCRWGQTLRSCQLSKGVLFVCLFLFL